MRNKQLDVVRTIQTYVEIICFRGFVLFAEMTEFAKSPQDRGKNNIIDYWRKKMEYRLLKELCLSITDCPHSTPVWTKKGKIVVRNFNIKNGLIDFSNPSYTDDNNYMLRRQRAIPEEGDLIITREAPMGEVGMVPPGIECCLGQRMVLLKVNPKVCNNYYLLYALQCDYVQQQISWSKGTGTTVSNLRIPHLENLNIPYMSLDEQEEAIKVLKILDALKVKKKQMVDNLRCQVSALFVSMFVERDFGSSNVKSLSNSLPQGWKVCQLKDVTTNIRKRVGVDEYKVLSAVNTGSLCLSEDYFTKQVFSKDISKYITVEQGMFAYNPARINIGSIGINNLGFVGCVSPVYVVIDVEEGYQYFFDFFFKTNHFKEEVKVRSSGSVRQALNYKDFGLINITYPSLEAVTEFNHYYQPFLRKIDQLLGEIELFDKMKIALLQKLLVVG